LRVGIIGLAFAGKTTLFNAITGADMPTGQGGVEPHRAMGTVPDQRLDFLAAIYQPRRTTHVQIEWVDVPGFAPGSDFDAQREAARFLEHARRMEALAQVVRCFDGGFGDPDPVGELTTVALELILADLQIVERRLERIRKERQLKGRLDVPQELALLERFHQQLESERPLRELTLTPDERRVVSGFSFLTLSPLLVVLNHAEGRPPAASVVQAAHGFGAGIVELCATVEAELTSLDAVDRPEYLAALGLSEPAANRMIRASYQALDLISFFTVGADECRAWSIRKDTPARMAAGAIHSDMERGFIRAEVCAFDDLHAAGSHAAAKTAGKVRLEGKNYQVQDGDIIEIRFCV
jgi:ribosome-binding ATPase